MTKKTISIMIKMIPKTLKAKNRLREAGTDIWISHGPIGEFRGKSAWLVQAPDNERTLRWVLNDNDPDFDIKPAHDEGV